MQNKKLEEALAVFKEAEEKEILSSKDRTIAVLIENQINIAKHSVRPEVGGVLLTEAAPAGNTAGVQNYDPVLIKMLRRALPNMIAYDIVGVQTMTMPTGLIFYQKARYTSQSNTEALKDEADTNFAGDPAYVGTQNTITKTTFLAGGVLYGKAMKTSRAESLGDGTVAWGEMTFSIDKVQVTAGSRALRSDYTVEMAQDLKNVHGLEAQALLADICANELLVETNRDVLRSMYLSSKIGMQTTTNHGVWNVTDDSTGRWFQEDAVSLIYSIGKDSNAINIDTRFGRGNFLVVSCNLADALAAAEKLDTSNVDMGDIDGAGATFVGNLGRFKVYIDPYLNDASYSFLTVGYKGATELEAGLFYCPYVPVEMFEAVNAETMQPALAMKTRYGIQFNPFSTANFNETDATNIVNCNMYYRKSVIEGF